MIGDKVMCIYPDHLRIGYDFDLEFGKWYPIEGEWNNGYFIKGLVRSKCNFLTMDQIRDKKINELLKEIE